MAMPIPLRERLRTALRAAMTERDRPTVSVLRSTLAAVDNAEAVDGAAVRAGAIEAGAVGLGAAETPRRELSESDIADIVRAEIDELRRAAADYTRAGHPARAADLHTQADFLEAFLHP